MAKPEHSQIPAEKLVELCSRSAYTLDGLWFTLVEQKFGTDTALEIDTEVWRRLCLTQAKRILKYFSIKESSSIRNLIKVIELDPLLVVYKPETMELTDKQAILRCTDCPPQKARIRDGRGEFPCKPVGIALFTSYAKVVDPNIKLTCLTCPPDAHPPQFWCEWQFEI
jgi:hypothetical protein